MVARNTPASVRVAPESDIEEIDRSRQMIAAANELLEDGGLDGLTVRALLKRTGLARRAFYELFAGKDDLVLAVFEEMFQETTDLFRAQAEEFSDPMEKIKNTVVGLVTGALQVEAIGRQRVSAMIQEHLRLALTRPEELQAALKPFHEFIAGQVTAGVRSGQLRKCDPVIQATLIYNLIATTLHSELLMQERGLPVEQRFSKLAEEIWEFCRRAIIA